MLIQQFHTLHEINPYEIVQNQDYGNLIGNLFIFLCIMEIKTNSIFDKNQISSYNILVIITSPIA